MTKLNHNVIKYLLLVGMLFWAPSQSRSAEVIVEPFGYENSTLVLIEEGDTFIICDCPKPPSLKLRINMPPLALKMTTNRAKPRIAILQPDFEPRVFTVHFGFGSFELTEYGQDKLEKIIEKINALPGKKQIVLDGYTCNVGDASYNDPLSLQRALTVKDQLESQGIIVDSTRGKGSCCPVSQENRLNRRVEISVNPFNPKGDQS